MNGIFSARKPLKLFGLFLLFYAMMLPLWLGLKAPYQQVVNTVAFKTAGWCYDIKLLKTHLQPDGTTVMTAANRYALVGFDGKDHSIVFDAMLDIDAITFNVPMTLALVLAIAFTLGAERKQRFDALVNAAILLVVLHFLTMFVISLSVIINTADRSPDLAMYLQHHWMPKTLLLNLGSLLSTYAARFEPFLISVFVWWQLQLQRPEKTPTEEETTQLPHF